MDFVKLELDGSTAVITIDRPKALNALNRQVLTELSETIGQVAANKALRALILTGGGEKAFVAGADIAEMANLDPPAAAAFAAAGHELGFALARAPQVVIAAVNGFALGGGRRCTILSSDTSCSAMRFVIAAIAPARSSAASRT